MVPGAAGVSRDGMPAVPLLCGPGGNGYRATARRLAKPVPDRDCVVRPLVRIEMDLTRVRLRTGGLCGLNHLNRLRWRKGLDYLGHSSQGEQAR